MFFHTAGRREPIFIQALIQGSRRVKPEVTGNLISRGFMELFIIRLNESEDPLVRILYCSSHTLHLNVHSAEGVRYLPSLYTIENLTRWGLASVNRALTSNSRFFVL